MDVRTKVEAIALIEKVKHEELPALAVMVLNAWCQEAGVSRATVEEFVKRMSAHGSSDLNDVLVDMLGDYEVGTTRFGQQTDLELD